MAWWSWGVDGFGTKHYLCKHCELVFGTVNPHEIIHACDTSKPKHHNKDKESSMNIETLTLQQETAQKEYNEAFEFCDAKPEFWGWYSVWCVEEGRFNDA